MAEVLGDAGCFHHQSIAHRVNTMAGSMRVTFMMAAIAEDHAHNDGQQNSAMVRPGRDDDRQRAAGRHAHDQKADQDRPG